LERALGRDHALTLDFHRARVLAVIRSGIDVVGQRNVGPSPTEHLVPDVRIVSNVEQIVAGSAFKAIAHAGLALEAIGSLSTDDALCPSKIVLTSFAIAAQIVERDHHGAGARCIRDDIDPVASIKHVRAQTAVQDIVARPASNRSAADEPTM